MGDQIECEIECEIVKKTRGRKPLNRTEEEMIEVRKMYNKKYFDSHKSQLKKTRQAKNMKLKVDKYDDDYLLNIIDIVGFERLLKLMI